MRYWRHEAFLVAAATGLFALMPEIKAGANRKPGLDARCNPDKGRSNCAYHNLRDFAFVGTATPFGDLPYRVKNGNFQGADLSGAKFVHAEVTDSNLEAANLTGARFEGGSRLVADNLFGAKFSGAGFDSVAMQNDRLGSATFDKALTVVSSFNNSNFTDARLVGTDLTSSDFIRADFASATLEGAREGRVNIFFGWTNFDGRSSATQSCRTGEGPTATASTGRSGR